MRHHWASESCLSCWCTLYSMCLKVPPQICEDWTTSCFWTGHEGKLVISCVHEWIQILVFIFTLQGTTLKKCIIESGRKARDMSTYLVDVVVLWVWLTILLHILQKNHAAIAYYYQWPGITGSFWTVTDCDPGLSSKYCHVSLTLQCWSEIVLTPLNTVICVAPLSFSLCTFNGKKLLNNQHSHNEVCNNYLYIVGWQTTHQKQWDG